MDTDEHRSARTTHRDNTSSTICLIGLGNPGARYRHTRHNMGFLAADAFVRRFGGIIQRKRTRSTDKTELIYNDRHIVVIKPLLYMNRSGDALISIRDQLLSPDNRVLVIYDDATLPFGALRFRRKGSSGGHRGFQSIIEQLKTNQINRLRIGIGGNLLEPLEEYVLSPLTREERSVLPDLLHRATEAIETYILLGIDEAMNRYN